MFIDIDHLGSFQFSLGWVPNLHPTWTIGLWELQFAYIIQYSNVIMNQTKLSWIIPSLISRWTSTFFFIWPKSPSISTVWRNDECDEAGRLSKRKRSFLTLMVDKLTLARTATLLGSVLTALISGTNYVCLQRSCHNYGWWSATIDPISQVYSGECYA